MKLPVIILAAGQSTRMRGRDKLLEPVDGTALLRRQAGIARAATEGPVVIALPPRPHARYEALRGLDVTCIEVPDAAEGMNASLRAAVAALPPQTPAAAVLLADLPEVTADDLRRVLSAVDPASGALIWRATTVNGEPGHPVVFASSLFGELLALTGDLGAQPVIRRHRDRLVLVPLPGEHARRDLDTPEDWDRWHRERESG